MSGAINDLQGRKQLVEHFKNGDDYIPTSHTSPKRKLVPNAGVDAVVVNLFR